MSPDGPDHAAGDDPAQTKLTEKTIRAQARESLRFSSRKNKLRSWQCEHCYDSNFPARGEASKRPSDPSTPSAVSAPPSIRVKVKLEPLGQSSVFAQFPSETETSRDKPAIPQPGPPIVKDRLTSPGVNVTGGRSSAPNARSEAPPLSSAATATATAGTRAVGRTLFELQYSPDISLALMCVCASLLVVLLRWWHRRAPTGTHSSRRAVDSEKDNVIATEESIEHKTDSLIVSEMDATRRERDESEGSKIDTKENDNQRSESDQLPNTPKPNKSGEELSNSATTSPELVLEDIYAEAQRSSPSPVHNPFIIHSISPESDSEPTIPDDTDDASAISGLTESSSNQPPMNSGLFGSPCAVSKETEVDAEERESLGTQLQRRFDIKVKHKLLSPFRKAKVRDTENDEMPVKPLPMSGKKKNVFADDNADDTTTDSSLNGFPVPDTKKNNNPEERPFFVFGTNTAAFPRSVPVSPFASPQKDRRSLPHQKAMYSPSALLRSTKTQT